MDRDDGQMKLAREIDNNVFSREVVRSRTCFPAQTVLHQPVVAAPRQVIGSMLMFISAVSLSSGYCDVISSVATHVDSLIPHRWTVQ